MKIKLLILILSLPLFLTAQVTISGKKSDPLREVQYHVDGLGIAHLSNGEPTTNYNGLGLVLMNNGITQFDILFSNNRTGYFLFHKANQTIEYFKIVDTFIDNDSNKVYVFFEQPNNTYFTERNNTINMSFSGGNYNLTVFSITIDLKNKRFIKKFLYNFGIDGGLPSGCYLKDDNGREYLNPVVILDYDYKKNIRNLYNNYNSFYMIYKIKEIKIILSPLHDVNNTDHIHDSYKYTKQFNILY